MGMTDARDILGTGGKIQCGDRLGDQLGGARTKDVDAQDAIGPGVGDHLDQALRLV